MSDRLFRYRWLVLVPLAVIYAASLPHSVQILDSGEMVTSAWGLTVPHAPGYPLYVWLYHALMVALPVGTVFFRAAIVTAACSLGACACLLRVTRDWVGVTAIAALATLPAVWRYAVLPDVFALSSLLAAAIIAIAFSPPAPWRAPAAALVFGLAAGNHHSVIFLLPLVLLVAWQDSSRPRAIVSLASGAVVTVALYASLFLLSPQHVNSWGDISSVSGLLRHFLRGDYGTFNLSTGGGAANLGSVLRDLAVTAGPFGLAGVAIAGLSAASDEPTRRNRTWWVLLGCLVAYLLLFIPRMNLGGEDDNAIGIRERFFLLPMLMLAALAATTRIRAELARVQGVFAALLTVLAVVQTSTGDTFELRRDVVVEQYTRYLLQTAVGQRVPAILFVDSDTKLFAARYLQASEPGFEDVLIIPRSMTYDRRLLERAKLRWPALHYDAEAVRTRKKMDIFNHLIAPNMASFSITHVMPYPSPRARTIFFPVGRGLVPGSGVAIADVPPVSPAPPVYRASSSEYVDTKEIFAEYTVYYLAKGKELLEKGDREGARQAFMDGLERVPYCIPCLKNLCAIDDNQDARCGQALRDLEANEYNYFE